MQNNPGPCLRSYLPTHFPGQVTAPVTAALTLMNLILTLLQSKLNASGFDWIRIESIHLSPTQKTLSADLKLAGESDLIRLNGTYSVTAENTIRLETLVASRQWLTEVADLILAKTGREFPLPEGLKGKLIRVFL